MVTESWNNQWQQSRLNVSVIQYIVVMCYAVLVICYHNSHQFIRVFCYHVNFFFTYNAKNLYLIYIYSASLFSDFSLSSQERSVAALPPAAWIFTRPSQIVVTTPWTASVANFRPFSGAVTESPILHSRFPNSPPAVTTAPGVASGTTWKPSWRKGPSTETRGGGARRAWRRKAKGWVCRALQLPRGATWVPLFLCPPLPPQHATPPRQPTSLTL